jgi:death-on-curing protein
MTNYLSVEETLLIVHEMGFVIRDEGLLGAAVARPQSSAFGEDIYQSFDEKCAALLDGVNRNHPLVDGNKRLSWVCATNFAAINGFDLVADQVEIFRAVTAVAAGHLELEALTQWIQAIRTNFSP